MSNRIQQTKTIQDLTNDVMKGKDTQTFCGMTVCRDVVQGILVDCLEYQDLQDELSEGFHPDCIVETYIERELDMICERHQESYEDEHKLKTISYFVSQEDLNDYNKHTRNG